METPEPPASAAKNIIGGTGCGCGCIGMLVVAGGATIAAAVFAQLFAAESAFSLTMLAVVSVIVGVSLFLLGSALWAASVVLD